VDASSTTKLSEGRSATGPSQEAKAEFSPPASKEQIGAVAVALEGNGITCIVVDTAEEARAAVRSILPVGAEVYNNTSSTLEVIGVAEDIERSGQYQALRPRLYQMDRAMQGREMRQLSASPDWVVGSAHALTKDGSLILVIGAQKLVPDFDTGLRRIYEYCFPLEDRRAREAYGVPSGVNNVLVVNEAIPPGRITAILVNEPLGF
jgi:hypothetical protein